MEVEHNELPKGFVDAFQNVGISFSYRNLATALFAASRDCVKLVDLDGRVIAVTKIGARLLQLDRDTDLVGRVWADFWPESGRAQICEALALGAKGQSSRFKGFCPSARGEPRWWEVSIVPVQDRDGKSQCLLVSSRDITAEHEKEQELTSAFTLQREALLKLSLDLEVNSRKLREAESRTVHDDKLRIFGRFVTGVVHDFNNIFAAVHGATRLLRRRALEPSALDIVTHVERASERGAKLTRQLLDFARQDPDLPEVFDPAAQVERDTSLLQHIVQERVSLVVANAPKIWPLLGSPAKFQSVLFNLVANARDAFAEGEGRIEVSLSNCASLNRPPGLDASDYVVLKVEDNGAGMTPEVLNKIGEPFFTTKPAGRGTGLGLASAFELASGCGGRVFIESKVGEGSRISVYLQRSPVGGEPVNFPDAITDPALHGGAKLLIVDDDTMVRDHLAALFRGLNYIVVEASSFEIANALVCASDDFDLVVTDMNLNDGLGIKLVEELRARRTRFPAVFVSGSSGTAVGRDEIVIRKPVSETRLAQAVLQALGRLPAGDAASAALAQVERIAEKLSHPDLIQSLAIWRRQLETTGRVPSVFDPGPWRQDLKGFNFVVAIVRATEPEFRFVRAGAALKSRLGRELIGTTVTGDDEDVLGSVARNMRRCLDGTPGYDYARFALGDGKVSTVERLLLPLCGADGEITHLVGLVVFDEISAPAMQAEKQGARRRDS